MGEFVVRSTAQGVLGIVSALTVALRSEWHSIFKVGSDDMKALFLVHLRGLRVSQGLICDTKRNLLIR